jgi:hypothetical protein
MLHLNETLTSFQGNHPVSMVEDETKDLVVDCFRNAFFLVWI